MTDQDTSSKAKDIIDSATGLVEAIPIYQDLVQPAAKELGTALETVAKTVNLALAPISGVIWGYDTIKDFVATKVAEKLKSVPPENIIRPSPLVAGPALEALKYTGHENTLREMYANLLASALDSSTAGNTHPSSVVIIQQLSASEAQLLNFLSSREEYPSVCSSHLSETVKGGFFSIQSGGVRSNQVKKKFTSLCEDVTDSTNVGAALDNFLRLKILNIESNTKQSLQENRNWPSSDKLTDKLNVKIELTEHLVFTDLGETFVDTCVKSKI